MRIEVIAGVGETECAKGVGAENVAAVGGGLVEKGRGITKGEGLGKGTVDGLGLGRGGGNSVGVGG